jgi:hypothetical protein
MVGNEEKPQHLVVLRHNILQGVEKYNRQTKNTQKIYFS